MEKMKVAVMFGERSPEHDVSVVTGLQTLDALDPDLYDAFPVYISPQGEWLAGDALRDRKIYIPGPSQLQNLEPVRLQFGGHEKPCLVPREQSSLFKRSRKIDIDFVVPAFHGLYGEDGRMQGLFEICGLPYCGTRTLASAVYMDKVATKRMLADSRIRQLPYWQVDRPSEGLFVNTVDLRRTLEDIQFPCCVKPAHLGSSIGVAKASNWEEVSAVLPAIFRFDTTAIIEPFVQHLVEYNVSVCRVDGQIRTSAIERPKHSSELLDFKAKYLSGGNKGDGKASGKQSEGMLSLTRDINPDIPNDMEKNIRDWAVEAFVRADGTGAPRIDFLSDRETGDLWLNEVNPCPGSFGYFLWEAANPAIGFSKLLDILIQEGLSAHRASQLPPDPTPLDARLFDRH